MSFPRRQEEKFYRMHSGLEITFTEGSKAFTDQGPHLRIKGPRARSPLLELQEKYFSLELAT